MSLTKTSRAKFVTAGAIALSILALSGSDNTAVAHNYLGQCTVNFDNTFALTNVYGNARATFASKSGINAAGKIDLCSKAVNPGVCWYYRHRCARNYVNVEEISGYGHYHLSFTGAGFNPVCGFGDPGDGYGSGFNKKVGTSCVIPNWSAEPRVLDGHDGTQWFSIQMHPAASMTTKTVFDLARLRIGGTQNVQVWFHSTIDGNWYGWPSMAPNNWNTVASSHDVDEVQISGTSSLSFEIEDFDILD